MDFNAFIKENYNDNDRIARMSINAPEHNYRVITYHYKATELVELDCAENNLYFALNPMKFIDKSIRRDKQHVSRLKFLYVDLDIYKSAWKGYSQEQIFMQLEAEYFGCKIPYPTYVINSGRGMYLLWKIDEHINAQPRWEKVQRYLHSQLLEFGADRAVVTDTARVLRVPGSINPKSGSKVHIMQSYEKEYTLYEIMQEYMQNDIISHKYINNKKSKRNYKKSSSKVIFMNTPYSLYTARLTDLEHLLINYRDKEGGMRENILFLYRYYALCICDDKVKALNSILELNKRLCNPLEEKEVIKATASAEKYYDENKSLQISNSKLIEFLNINDFEMKNMKSIISHAEKSKRKAERDRKAYLKKLAARGEETKGYKIKKRLKALYELLQQGKRQQEICAELNISRSTFYTDKKLLENYTYKQLCEVESVCNSAGTEDDNIIAFNSCPENSAPVLKEDVVLCSPYDQGGSMHFNRASSSYDSDVSCGDFPVLNTS